MLHSLYMCMDGHIIMITNNNNNNQQLDLSQEDNNNNNNSIQFNYVFEENNKKWMFWK